LVGLVEFRVGLYQWVGICTLSVGPLPFYRRRGLEGEFQMDSRFVCLAFVDGTHNVMVFGGTWGLRVDHSAADVGLVRQHCLLVLSNPIVRRIRHGRVLSRDTYTSRNGQSLFVGCACYWCLCMVSHEYVNNNIEK
jgi:hypothetical protein